MSNKILTMDGQPEVDFDEVIRRLQRDKEKISEIVACVRSPDGVVKYYTNLKLVSEGVALTEAAKFFMLAEAMDLA